jgi:hypothetical protein
MPGLVDAGRKRFQTAEDVGETRDAHAVIRGRTATFL